MPIKAPQHLVKKNSWADRFLYWVAGWSREYILQFFSAVVIVGLGVLILRQGFFDRFETIFLDLLFRWRPSIAASSQIVYVEIAEDSLQAIKERPWPRHYHGVILEILKSWGARAVLFDYIFEGASNPFDDDVMTESLKKNKGVYFPVFIETLSGQKVVLRSIPEFEQQIDGVGHINLHPDNDGILRRFKPFIEAGGVFYPHLGLKMAYDILGLPIKKESDIKYPTDENGFVIISWPGRWIETFKHFSYVDVLKSFERIKGGGKPIVNPVDFKNKICLVGSTAAGSTDIKATPLDKSYPGLGIVASIINGALLNEFIEPAGFKRNAWGMVVVAFFAILFFFPFRNLISFLGGVGLIASWFGFVYFMFAFHGIWFNLVQPTALVLILFIFFALVSKISSDRERLHFYQLSTTDGLTNVATRRFFDVMGERNFVTAKKFKLPLSVVLIDIDHFKKVNDTYGHQAGDEVLRETAKLIRSGIRIRVGQTDGDLLARYGGEEFVLLLPNTDLKTATFNVAERIRKMVEAGTVQYAEHAIVVTISLGVASLHDFDETLDSIIKRADDALYRSKETGRNKTSIEAFA